MSTQSLSSVAVHVVGRYHEAGKTLVGAYRTGSRRLLRGAGSRSARVQKVTDFLSERLDTGTDRVISVMDFVAEASTKGIKTVAGRIARIESPVATSVVDTLTAINLPLVNVSAQIAEGVVAGARQIDLRVRGAQPVRAARSVKSKAVRKTVRKTAKHAARKTA